VKFTEKNGGDVDNLAKVKGTNSAESHNPYKLTVFDVVLIAFILLFSVGVILHTKFGLNWQLSKVSEAFVYHEGQLFKRLNLERDQELPLLSGKMLIEIKQRRIRVRESDCPRQVCVNTGWIRYPGETVVCVPYRVLIEVKSVGSPIVDAVVY